MSQTREQYLQLADCPRCYRPMRFDYGKNLEWDGVGVKCDNCHLDYRGRYSTDVRSAENWNAHAADLVERFYPKPDQPHAKEPTPIAWRYILSDGTHTSFWFDCEEQADLLAEKQASFKIEYAYPLPAIAAGIPVREG